MGFANLVEYDPEMKKYFPTREYDETNVVMDAIVDYDNESFWEELMERLATRDLILKEGKEKVMAMDDEERLVKTENCGKISGIRRMAESAGHQRVTAWD